MKKEAQKPKKMGGFDRGTYSKILKTKDPELLELFIEHLKEFHRLTSDEIIKTISKKKILLPISIFDNKKLSVLEAVVKYLKEGLNLGVKDIANLLNRSLSTISITYSRAKKKRKEKFVLKESKIFIPVSIFKDRSLGALEVISVYLKEQYKLRYHEIALLLKRNDRTIWTAYHRAKKKGKLKR